MGKKIYTTYVNIVLRCGTTTSGPVGSFEFDHTEDAVQPSTLEEAADYLWYPLLEA